MPNETIDISEIKAALKLQNKIRYDKGAWDNMPLIDFVLAASFAGPLSRLSQRIENKLYKELDVPLDNINIRGAFVSDQDGSIRANQIQLDKMYLFYLFDKRDLDNVAIQFFFFTAEQIKKEVKFTGSKSVLGSVQHMVATGGTQQYSISINLDSPNHIRWTKEYGITLEALKPLLKRLNNLKAFW